MFGNSLWEKAETNFELVGRTRMILIRKIVLGASA